MNDLSHLDIEAGSYSEVVTAVFPTVSSSARYIYPKVRPSYGVSIVPIICPANTNTVSFNIGIADYINTTFIIIEWDSVGYIKIRPVEINVWKNHDIHIYID